MIELENFDLLETSGISYGGHGGSKKGVILNKERWFLKFSNFPLSEYLASHIYESIEIETHKTKLGIVNGLLVVACKDFLNANEIIIDYSMIKNDYNEIIEKEIESLSSSYSLEEIFIVMRENRYFKIVSELRTRFWDMFVIDTFIGINDRNKNDWGLVLNRDTSELRVVPVFDNDKAFLYEMDSIYKFDNKPINPLKYIEGMSNDDCNKAILRIVPRIDMEKIKKIFDMVPCEYNGFPILSNIQRDYYLKAM